MAKVGVSETCREAGICLYLIVAPERPYVKGISALLRSFVLDWYEYQVGTNTGVIDLDLRLLGSHAFVIAPKLVRSHIMKGEKGEAVASTMI